MLDEVADILNDLTAGSHAPVASSHAPSIPELILTALMNKTNMPSSHASKETEREIYEIDPTTTTLTEENERSGYSTEPIGAERNNEGNV